MLDMFLLCLREDQDIVKETKMNLFTISWRTSLKELGRTLEVANGGLERDLPLIALPNSDKAIGIPEIEFSEDLGILKGICSGQ